MQQRYRRRDPTHSRNSKSRKQQQPKLASFFVRPMSIEKKKKNDAILKMIVMDMQPFSIVEDDGFCMYTQALDPTYVLPSKT